MPHAPDDTTTGRPREQTRARMDQAPVAGAVP